jgi:hypothetical protein
MVDRRIGDPYPDGRRDGGRAGIHPAPDEANVARDLPNKTDQPQNHRRFLDRLWLTVWGMGGRQIGVGQDYFVV